VLASPAAQLWTLLVKQPPRAGRKIHEATAHKLVRWLPETIRDRALALLLAGNAIPQEALRFDVLTDALG
jgi:hypothetical protein